MAETPNANFGAFLTAVNIGKSQPGPVDYPVDAEGLGKAIMNVLGTRSMSREDLSSQMSLPIDVVNQAVNYLVEHEMAVETSETGKPEVQLTDFAKEALRVFAVR
jgi:hypothetical protein